jgi:hypothetical protein
MGYKLEKMGLPEMRMIFEVLEEIRKTCSSRDNAFVIWGKDKKTENVSSNDLIHIIGTLHREGYLKRYSFLTAFIGTSFRIIIKKFEPFYYEVKKRLEVLEQKNPEEIKPEEEILSLDFNPQTGILYFRNKEIEMSIRKDKTNAHYILDYIFGSEEGLDCEFDYSEIAEGAFKEEYDDNKSWKKYYRACKDIQEKVREATEIKDFLDIKSGKTGWVKINEKYLE